MAALRTFGLSLAETVVASFLLLAGFLVVGRLFYTSLRYQVWIDSVTLATVAGENTLERVRTWASVPANFANLEAVYSPLTIQQEDVTIEILAGPAVPMASPSDEFENAFPATERRLLRRSYKRVDLKVQTRRDSVTLSALLGDPPHTLRTTNPVVIQATGANPMARDGVMAFRASVYDDTDSEIPDVFLNWTSEPVTGKGTMQNIARDGQSAEMVHKMMLPNGTFGYSPPVAGVPAVCQVGVSATYRGQQVTALSAPLSLSP